MRNGCVDGTPLSSPLEAFLAMHRIWRCICESKQYFTNVEDWVAMFDRKSSYK